MADKQRLDNLIYEKGLSDSREKARRLIMSGRVMVDGLILDKPGEKVDLSSKIDVRGTDKEFVSRGGYKLDKAIKTWHINLEGLVCLDVGASTGGFTDCMLKHGAHKVYAVDVGYGQLAYNIRSDPRVVVIEKTNIRYIDEHILNPKPDFVAVDVSFISLKLVLNKVKSLINFGSEIICLIKPQFEAGKQQVGKNGVVKDSDIHYDVIVNISNFAKELGFGVSGLDYSPITGPKGNIEFLLWLKHSLSVKCIDFADVAKDVVLNSRQLLD